MDIRHLYVRGLVSDEKVEIELVFTKDQLSDRLTKPLPAPAIQISNDRFNLKERIIFDNNYLNTGQEGETLTPQKPAKNSKSDKNKVMIAHSK